MTVNPEISRRLHEHYHRVENNEVIKTIFNFGKNKEGKGMKSPDWMLTEEMKQTIHYKMYATVFRVDVPTNQSQPIESTHGTHKTTSTPRTPNLETTEGESSAQRKPTVIRFRVPRRPDPETPIPTSTEIDITNFLVECEKVKEHVVDEELEQLLEGTKNVDEDAFMDEVLNSQENPSTRIEPMSDKEIMEVKKNVDVVNIHDGDKEEN
ncbi:hypothetical protein Tco_0707205 [Tanacetum coccineum]|uniref:Uncharacterized protein n=1 Tax=Tanacetum coccineum TaxID=301880 RepID=A0ABQ4Y9K8_9ASTR